MDKQTSSPGSPTEIARAALAVIGMDPASIAEVSVLPGGIGACDAYALTMSDESRFVLKAQLPGGPPDHIAALKREALFYRHLAPRLPISPPKVHGICTDESVGITLLIGSYSPSPPVEHWTEALYLQAAGDLARLHATFWDGADDLAACGFLGHRTLDVSDADTNHARECWTYLSTVPRFEPILGQDRLRWLEAQIQTVQSRIGPLAALPPTLIHGDCHVGNILIGECGDLVWTNWTCASVGRGPEDVSFLYQRAEFAGGTVPCNAMVEAYHAGLRGSGLDVPMEAVRSAADASEWSVRLLQWPHYMDYASPQTLRSFMERLDFLATTVHKS
ncbi:MAG TPA: aminoglycoside phosphotransferase family protein [Armatimonadota bacterium]|jgi:aminoglycoside phosphotransferase (APT) family kinase protein